MAQKPDDDAQSVYSASTWNAGATEYGGYDRNADYAQSLNTLPDLPEDQQLPFIDDDRKSSGRSAVYQTQGSPSRNQNESRRSQDYRNNNQRQSNASNSSITSTSSSFAHEQNRNRYRTHHDNAGYNGNPRPPPRHNSNNSLSDSPNPSYLNVARAPPPPQNNPLPNQHTAAINPSPAPRNTFISGRAPPPNSRNPLQTNSRNSAPNQHHAPRMVYTHDHHQRIHHSIPNNVGFNDPSRAHQVNTRYNINDHAQGYNDTGSHDTGYNNPNYNDHRNNHAHHGHNPDDFNDAPAGYDTAYNHYDNSDRPGGHAAGGYNNHGNGNFGYNNPRNDNPPNDNPRNDNQWSPQHVPAAVNNQHNKPSLAEECKMRHFQEYYQVPPTTNREPDTLELRFNDAPYKSVGLIKKHGLEVITVLIQSPLFKNVVQICQSFHWRIHNIHKKTSMTPKQKKYLYRQEITEFKVSIYECYKRGAMRSGLIDADRKIGDFNFKLLSANSLRIYIAYWRRTGNYHGQQIYHVGCDGKGEHYVQLNDNPLAKRMVQFVNSLADFWAVLYPAGGGKRFAEWVYYQKPYYFS